MLQNPFDPQKHYLSTGWLLADLLLGLSMVFLAIGSSNSTIRLGITKDKINPTSTPSKSSLVGPNLITPSITPTLSEYSRIGLDQTPQKFTISVDVQGFLQGNFGDDFKKKVGGYLDTSRRAGLVITLGYHPKITSGVALAEMANSLLLRYYPNVFSGAVEKAYWMDTIRYEPGTIEFEIYYFGNNPFGNNP